MSANLFKDLGLTNAQINSNYELKQLKILNDAQTGTNTTVNDNLTKLNNLNPCVGLQDANTNIVYGKGNSQNIANVSDNSNLIIGNGKTATLNNGNPFQASERATVIGNGVLNNNAVVPNDCIMIGHGCAPPTDANIAFGGALEAVDDTALDVVATLAHRVPFWYNGVRYWLYLAPNPP